MLRAQLARAPEQNRRRNANARCSMSCSRRSPGITPQKLDARCTSNGQYAYIYRWDAKAFAGIDRKRYIEAVKAEGLTEQASYPALHGLAVFQDPTAYEDAIGADRVPRMKEIVAGRFPNTARGADETVWITQTALLGDEQDMHEIAAAIRKIQENAKELA